MHPNGDIYEGDFKNNIIEGEGISKSKEGNYTGSWSQNERNGQGYFEWNDGDHYQGNWVDNLRSGKGKFVSLKGDTYEGLWKEDKRHGMGVRIYADGTTYKG